MMDDPGGQIDDKILKKPTTVLIAQLIGCPDFTVQNCRKLLGSSQHVCWRHVCIQHT